MAERAAPVQRAGVMKWDVVGSRPVAVGSMPVAEESLAKLPAWAERLAVALPAQAALPRVPSVWARIRAWRPDPSRP